MLLPYGVNIPMGLMNTRTQIVIAKELLITNAAELLRLRQSAALKTAAGAWSKAGHPELKNGVERHVRELRRESEVRFNKQQAG